MRWRTLEKIWERELEANGEKPRMIILLESPMDWNDVGNIPSFDDELTVCELDWNNFKKSVSCELVGGGGACIPLRRIYSAIPVDAP